MRVSEEGGRALFRAKPLPRPEPFGPRHSSGGSQKENLLLVSLSVYSHSVPIWSSGNLETN
jgi:hypothetical protein